MHGCESRSLLALARILDSSLTPSSLAQTAIAAFSCSPRGNSPAGCSFLTLLTSSTLFWSDFCRVCANSMAATVELMWGGMKPYTFDRLPYGLGAILNLTKCSAATLPLWGNFESPCLNIGNLMFIFLSHLAWLPHHVYCLLLEHTVNTNADTMSFYLQCFRLQFIVCPSFVQCF